MKLNKICSKPFLVSAFAKQNQYHRHGVIVHTLKVVYQLIKNKHYALVPAGILHDIGKPFTAKQDKQEDIDGGWYSFKNHEEMSWFIIRNWPFVSDYTKDIVRYHYLIRDISKSAVRDPKRHKRLKKRWDGLSEDMKKDLRDFLVCDDMGK